MPHKPRGKPQVRATDQQELVSATDLLSRIISRGGKDGPNKVRRNCLTVSLRNQNHQDDTRGDSQREGKGSSSLATLPSPTEEVSDPWDAYGRH